MTDATNTSASEKKDGSGKVWSGFVAALASSYIMNQFSLHGVNFDIVGQNAQVLVSSEIVKSSIDASIVSFLVWVTPQNIVDEIVCFIVFLRRSWGKIQNAIDGKDDAQSSL